MQPGAHRSEDNGFSRVGLTRGILVIVTAVAVGAFVLAQGLDDSSVEAVATAGTESDEASAETTTTLGAAGQATTTTLADDATMEESGADGTTTSTTSAPASPGIRSPSEVPVLVLNGAGTKGVAGRASEVLQTAGYPVLAPKNAKTLRPTSVLYTEGFQIEALAVAEAFGLDPLAVVEAYDAPTSPIDDIRDAIIIVVIGQDGLIDV